MCLPMIPCGPLMVVMKPILSFCCAAAGSGVARNAATPAASTPAKMDLITASSSGNIVQPNRGLTQSSGANARAQVGADAKKNSKALHDDRVERLDLGRREADLR